MWKTVVRRVLLMIPQIIILSVLVFGVRWHYNKDIQ